MPRRTIAILAVLGLVALALLMTVLDAGVDAGQTLLPGPASDFLDRLTTLLMMFAVAALVLYLSRLDERTVSLETALARAGD